VELNCLDRLSRSVSTVLSRRAVARALGLGALALPDLAGAKKHHHKHKVKFNDFGCVNVGNVCTSDDQCCSGICEGKQGKKTCQAHDQSTCQAGQNIAFCGGSADGDCVDSSGTPGGDCFTTTGNAGICAQGGGCFICTKDVDCQAVFGPGAACATCPTCAEEHEGNAGTLCVVLVD
jgi:hypothetical protein